MNRSCFLSKNQSSGSREIANPTESHGCSTMDISVNEGANKFKILTHLEGEDSVSSLSKNYYLKIGETDILFTLKENIDGDLKKGCVVISRYSKDLTLKCGTIIKKAGSLKFRYRRQFHESIIQHMSKYTHLLPDIHSSSYRSANISDDDEEEEEKEEEQQESTSDDKEEEKKDTGKFEIATHIAMKIGKGITCLIFPSEEDAQSFDKMLGGSSCLVSSAIRNVHKGISRKISNINTSCFVEEQPLWTIMCRAIRDFMLDQ